jgi:Uncharacterised protein family UPF0547
VSERTMETRVCPDCAETVKAQARVCRSCGYRFGTLAAASRGSSMESILAKPLDRRGWFLLWGLASALLMVLGSVGPWARFGAVAFGRGGALLVLALAVIGAALLVVWRERRAAGIAALVIGLLGLAVTLHARRRLRRLILGMRLRAGIHFFTPGFIHVGWGLDLALLSSLSLALCGLVWLIALREQPPEQARLVDATPSAAQR